MLNIRHLVIDGSFLWIIGQNVTKLCNIQHICGQFLNFPDGSKMQLLEKDMHSYIDHKLFTCNKEDPNSEHKSAIFCATANLPSDASSRPWKEIKKIIDKVHRHVCGHSSFLL